MSDQPPIIDLDRLSAGNAHLADDPPPQPPVDSGLSFSTPTKDANLSSPDFVKESNLHPNSLQWLTDDCIAKARLLNWSAAEIEQIRSIFDFSVLHVTQQKISRELKQAFQVESLYENPIKSSRYPQLDLSLYC